MWLDLLQFTFVAQVCVELRNKIVTVPALSAAGSAADIHAGSRSIAAPHSSHINSQMNSYGPPDLLVHSTTAPSTGKI